MFPVFGCKRPSHHLVLDKAAKMKRWDIPHVFVTEVLGLDYEPCWRRCRLPAWERMIPGRRINIHQGLHWFALAFLLQLLQTFEPVDTITATENWGFGSSCGNHQLYHMIHLGGVKIATLQHFPDQKTDQWVRPTFSAKGGKVEVDTNAPQHTITPNTATNSFQFEVAFTFWVNPYFTYFTFPGQLWEDFWPAMTWLHT